MTPHAWRRSLTVIGLAGTLAALSGCGAVKRATDDSSGPPSTVVCGGETIQTAPGMYVVFAGATEEELDINLAEFDTSYVSEVLGIPWLTAASDQKTQVYFRLAEYPPESVQEEARSVLLATGRVASVEFAPIGLAVPGSLDPNLC